MSRTAIREVLRTPGFVGLQFAQRHGIPPRTLWRMKKKKPDHPPSARTLKRFTEAIEKDRAAGLIP